jgi:hypothetical protein
MHQVKKESLCDWSVTLNGNHFAFITRNRDKTFVVKFKGHHPVQGFASFMQAKTYVRNYKWAE